LKCVFASFHVALLSVVEEPRSVPGIFMSRCQCRCMCNRCFNERK